MADITFDLAQFDRFQRGFQRLVQDDQRGVLEYAGRRAGAAFDEVVRNELPPPVRTRPQAQYWSARQRAWWWATMHKKARGQSHALPGWKARYARKGGRKVLVLSGSYRRTGTMIRTLAYRVQASRDEVQVFYGTNRPYAKWVIDRRTQAAYHKGNWRTLQVLQRAYTLQITDEFQRAAFEELERRIARL